MTGRAPSFAALREFVWRLRESPKDYRYARHSVGSSKARPPMPATEVRDWLVWFAHKVASEDERRTHLPGSSWCLMLREDEAHEVVGQMNETIQREAEAAEIIARCAADTTAADLAQAMEFLKTALVQIIDLARDEPSALNYASRASRIAREALGWERE